MASNGGDGRQVQHVDNECGCVNISVFPLFFLNFVLYAVGGTYDDDGGTYNDLSEAGSIFGVSKHFILYH